MYSFRTDDDSNGIVPRLGRVRGHDAKFVPEYVGGFLKWRWSIDSLALLDAYPELRDWSFPATGEAYVMTEEMEERANHFIAHGYTETQKNG